MLVFDHLSTNTVQSINRLDRTFWFINNFHLNFGGVRSTLTILSLFLTFSSINAQIKIGNNAGTINPSSIIELEATDKGIVLPRVTLNDASTPAPLLAGLAVGTTIYNLNGTEPIGFYFWNGSKWVLISSQEPWRESITGNDARYGSTTDTYYSAGNVGIGNATPDDLLDVFGNSHLNGALFVGEKTTLNGNGLKFHTDQTNNYLDSRIPTSGYTLFRADNSNGTTNRLAINNTTGFFGVHYSTGDLYAELDVNGIMHIRGGGSFAANPGLHIMYEIQNVNSNTVELISDHYGSTTGPAGFAWYTTQQNVPLKMMALDSLGILNFSNYGGSKMHFDSSTVGISDVQYLIGVQADGDVVETPNPKMSFFEGDVGGFSVLSAFPVAVDAAETSDVGGNFNPSNSTYTVPYDGLYLLKLNGFATALASTEVRIKIGTNSSNDGTEYYIPLQGAISSSIASTQLIEFQKGDAIKVYVDTGIGTQFNISRGYWSIICVQAF